MATEVIVDLGMALICFLGQCHPALVGESTPAGEFQLVRYTTESPGYGGDLLVFKEDDIQVWAIHRVLNVRGQHRPERLKSKNANRRKFITNGCVNIDPVVYDELVDCCSNATLRIKGASDEKPAARSGSDGAVPSPAGNGG